MSFCMKCGNKLEDKDLFCLNCGTKVEKEAQIQQEVTENKKSVSPECLGNQYTPLEPKENNIFNRVIIIWILLITLGCVTGYILKDSFYNKYYTYMSNKSTSPIDKLLFSDKALGYKNNDTSINNYENAIKQNTNNNLSLVISSLQNNKTTLPKDIFTNMIIDAYKQYLMVNFLLKLTQ